MSVNDTFVDLSIQVQTSRVVSYSIVIQVQPTIDKSTAGSAFYGHHLTQQQQQQQHQVGSLLPHHHHQYHQQRATAVRDTFQIGCHDDRDAIPHFPADRYPDVPGTSLNCTMQQRQPGTSFPASQGVPEMTADRACVDRYDYVLFGCDQFAKISFVANFTAVF